MMNFDISNNEYC